MKLNEYKILLGLIQSEKFATYCERMMLARSNFLKHRNPTAKDILECVKNNEPLIEGDTFTLNIFNSISQPVATTIKGAIGKFETNLQNDYFLLAIHNATYYAMQDFLFSADQPEENLKVGRQYAVYIIRELSEYFLIDGHPQH